MKYFNTLRMYAVAFALLFAGSASAQTGVIQPPKFPDMTGGGTSSNFYANYVGIRFMVTAPLSIAGSKGYTTSNDGSGGTGAWGAAIANMSNVPVMMDTTGVDTNGCAAAFPTGFFTGKVALIWRGSCEFGYKASTAQTAGAVAVIIVNNVAGGPVGMAAGSYGSGVTIPVFMISLDDGLAIASQIHAHVPVKMSIVTDWYSGNRNDLGFVPAGFSTSAYAALPYSQIGTSSATGQAAYAQKDGAYIANYGSQTQTHVKLKSELSWQATGAGSATTVHTDSITKTGAFPQTDSIWAMYVPSYNLPAATSTGTYTMKYTISADSADQFAGDNVLTYNFQATDSLYSKGRYDLAHHKPFATYYTTSSTAQPLIWCVPYYIANGGQYFDSAQFSVVNGTGLLPADYVYIYVFKWTDQALNTGSSTIPVDSFMENAELELVSTGIRSFDGTTDSAFKTYGVALGDSNGVAADVRTTDNTWYVLGASILANYALGCDGFINEVPRVFGRRHFDNYAEYYNPIWFGDRNSSTNSSGTATYQLANPYSALYPYSFDGTGGYTVDSIVYDNQKGLVPAIPFQTRRFPILKTGDVTPLFNNFNVYPNPTNGVVNATIELKNPANYLVYTVIDATGKTISTTKHLNVQNDTFNYDASALPTGNYYILINADGKTAFRKFTVAH